MDWQYLGISWGINVVDGILVDGVRILGDQLGINVDGQCTPVDGLEAFEDRLRISVDGL